MRSAALRSVWSKFRARRRSYYSLWIFAILALLSLFAEFLANDRPWLILMDDRVYVPIFTDYTERDFGGELDWHVNYRDDYMRAFLADKNAIQVWPPIPFSGTGIDYELSKPTPSPPDAIHWLGTDDQGRDLLARVLYGYRISIVFAFLLTLFTVVLGVLFGAVQGYYGGLPDLLGQRVIEVWSGMPVLFILIILASLVQPNLWWLLFITLLFSWMGLADLVRAEFLRGRNMTYVLAARNLGVRDTGIMFTHILPNAAVSVFTFVPLIFTSAVSVLASLDFLGYGLPLGTPSLGELIAQAKTNLTAPWIGITAFVVITLMLSLLVFVGEGLRDSFDPRIL